MWNRIGILIVFFQLTSIVLCGAVTANSSDDRYKITIKSVSVEDTKEDGADWDAGGNEPDLFVQVSDGDTKVRTKTKQDSFLAKLNTSIDIQFELGDQIELRVVDEDLTSDDLAGESTLIITDEILEKGVVLQFGRVKALVLTFKPVR